MPLPPDPGFLCFVGPAKKFVWVFPWHLMEKPKQTYCRTQYFLVRVVFTILHPSYKWNHIILSFCAWFISLSIKSFFFFRAVLGLQHNWTEDRDFPYTPCWCCTQSLPTVSTLHPGGTFVTINKPISTRQYHPEPVLYVSVHFWWCMFQGFWGMNGTCPPL